MPLGLRHLARQQALAISREQVLDFQISDRVIGRWLREDLLTQLSRGVYALGEGGWMQQAWAGILLGGTAPVLGLEAAGHLHGIVPDPPDQIAVFVGRHAEAHRDERWRFIESHRDGVGWPPRTTVAQTIVDLTARLDADDIAALLARSIDQKVSAQRVLAVLQQTKRHRHRRLLTDILGDVAEGSRSPLEVRYARDVERAHGLPKSRRQQSPSGKLCDVWYEDYGVLVELDGRPYHGGLAAWRDMGRDNVHQLRGAITLRYGWQPVAGAPCAVMWEVAEAITQRGWTDQPTRCKRCP